MREFPGDPAANSLNVSCVCYRLPGYRCAWCNASFQSIGCTMCVGVCVFRGDQRRARCVRVYRRGNEDGRAKQRGKKKEKRVANAKKNRVSGDFFPSASHKDQLCPRSVGRSRLVESRSISTHSPNVTRTRRCLSARETSIGISILVCDSSEQR